MKIHKAQFYFLSNLNDFLPKCKKNKQFIYSFKGKANVKNIIEAIGIPHPEIHKIFVNNKKVNFKYIVKDNDVIHIHPLKYNFFNNIYFFKKNKYRFIADVHLGKLKTYLRICGFDVVFNINWDDNNIIKIANEQNRYILTRDKGLLKNKNVQKGYWIRSQNPEKQIIEILRRYSLYKYIKPFRRCIHCNSLIKSVKKQNIKIYIKTFIYNKYKSFYKCLKCEKIYWKGPHYINMKNIIKRIKKCI